MVPALGACSQGVASRCSTANGGSHGFGAAEGTQAAAAQRQSTGAEARAGASPEAGASLPLPSNITYEKNLPTVPLLPEDLEGPGPSNILVACISAGIGYPSTYVLATSSILVNRILTQLEGALWTCGQSSTRTRSSCKRMSRMAGSGASTAPTWYLRTQLACFTRIQKYKN